MTLEAIILFNLMLCATMFSPGPALIVTIKTNVSHGFKQGLLLGYGLGLGGTLWTLAALFGLDILFKLFPWLYVFTKICAAIYLLYLAFKMWQSAHLPIASSAKPNNQIFMQGVLINLMNPKAILFAGSTLVVIFPPDIQLSERIFISLNQLFLECLFYTILACLLRMKQIGASYLQAKLYFDRFAASVLGFLALQILFKA